MSSSTKGHSRSWSLRSKKEDLKLTQTQKKRGKMTKNVDPTRAITEEEPFQVNQSQNHYLSLSQLKFKDRFGNDIIEPDLTNPTRSRWESPLETIRGFEAAIYKDEHRGSYVDTVDSIDGNSTWRHNRHQQQGHYQPSIASMPRRRPPPDALHYTGRSGYSETPRSAVDSYGESELGFGNMTKRSPAHNFGHGYAQPQERTGRPPRRPNYDAPDYDVEGPSSGGPQNQPYAAYTYPTNGGGESPINPGSSSSGAGSDGPGGYIREPALPQQQSFGFRDQTMFESSQQITPFESFSPSGPSQVGQNMPAHSVPTSPVDVARKPIPLNSSTPKTNDKPEEKKRKSWFKRKNSKG